MEYFEGTRLFEFEQFGIHWCLELTHCQVRDILRCGISVLDVSTHKIIETSGRLTER
jgi:hypothetical protein